MCQPRIYVELKFDHQPVLICRSKLEFPHWRRYFLLTHVMQSIWDLSKYGGPYSANYPMSVDVILLNPPEMQYLIYVVAGYITGKYSGLRHFQGVLY